MGKYIFFLAFVVLFSCQNDDKVDLSPEDQWEQAANSIVADYQLKGISMATTLPADSYYAVAGESDIGLPVDSTMLFSAASITKMFTSVLVLQLVEEGLINLDDPVGDYLPFIKNVDSDIPIRNLMNHTSGIANYTENTAFISDMINSPEKVWTPEEILSYVGLSKFDWGTSWGYSNSNYILLGMVLEATTDTPVESLYKTRIFDPLSLNTAILPPFQDSPFVEAKAHSSQISGLIGETTTPSMKSAAWTAGGIFCNAHDLVSFGRAVFDGTLLSDNSRSMLTDFVNVDNFFPHVEGYGLGLMKSFTLTEYWGHTGDFFGYASALVYLPDEEIVFVIMINQEVNEGKRMDIINRLITLVKGF